MNLVLDILNVKVHLAIEGNVKSTVLSVLGPGDFQSQSFENMMLRMEGVDFQLSKKTEIKGIDVSYPSMFTCHINKYANIYSFHSERLVMDTKIKLHVP